MNSKDDMLEEYDFSNGIRGKYAEAHKEGVNIVKIGVPILATEQIFNEISQLKPLNKLQLIDEIWENEAEARVDAYERGLVSVVNEDDVFGKYL